MLENVTLFNPFSMVSIEVFLFKSLVPSLLIFFLLLGLKQGWCWSSRNYHNINYITVERQLSIVNEPTCWFTPSSVLSLLQNNVRYCSGTSQALKCTAPTHVASYCQNGSARTSHLCKSQSHIANHALIKI